MGVMGGRHGQVEPLRAYGQPRRIVHETGAQVYFGSDREDQPLVVNMPGECCETEFDTGLAWCHQLGGSITRVDLANDVGPNDLARSRLWQMIESFRGGKVDTRMRRESIDVRISDRPGEGHTAYFGGKQSNLMLRAYDMRGPLRLEFQWSPPKPTRPLIPPMLLQDGPAGVWRSLAKDHLWPLDWYMRLLDAETCKLPPVDPEAATTLTKAWDALREQHGANLWAFMLAGFKLEDLAKAPPDKMRGTDVKKFLGWSREAADLGYDGSKLAAEVEKRSKRARVVKK